MVVAKQVDIRSNIKKYFDMAYNGESIVVPRVHNKNIVIISEEEYNRLIQIERVGAYARSFEKIQTSRTIRSENMEKLDSMQALPDGWNGNSATAFPSSLIERVRVLINGLRIQPEIFPTALGTIQLEYDNSRKDHMEIEINDSDTAEVFIANYNGSEHFESIPSDLDSINEKVRDFYE